MVFSSHKNSSDTKKEMPGLDFESHMSNIWMFPKIRGVSPKMDGL